MDKLFGYSITGMQAQDIVNDQMEQYRKIIEGVKDMLEGVTDQDSANACMKAIADMPHALTSKKECGMMINAKCASLGLKYEKATASYIPAGDQK